MQKLLAQSFTIGDGGEHGPAFDISGPEGFLFADANLGKIIGDSLGYVFAAAGIGLLLMIISSGFKIMTSAGDAKKLAAGRASLTNALVGFVLVFGAFWLVQIAGIILGWDTYIGTIFQ
jgi:hypothetical protein